MAPRRKPRPLPWRTGPMRSKPQTSIPPWGAHLAPVAQGALWVTRGSLAAAGTWRADVLVRTVAVDQYRTLPFTFTVGPG